MKKNKKNNIVNFPSNLSSGEREVEAILFAAAEPLDIDTIESKLSKNINVEKVLNKLKDTYSSRGINLVCISKRWSFRTAQNLSNLMSQQKTVEKSSFPNEETSFCTFDTYLLAEPIHEPTFLSIMGKSLGPIIIIANETMINISNQPICGI